MIWWQAELLEADERAGRRYIQQIEELRDQLEREKESACSRERELSQQRYIFFRVVLFFTVKKQHKIEIFYRLKETSNS